MRVAVVHEPREAIPLQGTWFGAASDHLAMKVAVKVHRNFWIGLRLMEEWNFFCRLVLSRRPAVRLPAEEDFDEDSCGLRDFL